MAKMLVETYECEELADAQPEVEAGAVELVKQLGLAGQKSLLCPAPAGTGETKLRCPYREMMAEERFVFNLLCPEHVAAERYAASPIPLRVLQVLSHAMSLNFFERIEVWAGASQTVKDPVLVGIRQRAPDRTWDKVAYILARWGEELDEWPALAAKALRQWREAAQEKALAITARVKADTDRLEHVSVAVAIKHSDRPLYYGLAD